MRKNDLRIDGTAQLLSVTLATLSRARTLRKFSLSLSLQIHPKFRLLTHVPIYLQQTSSYARPRRCIYQKLLLPRRESYTRRFLRRHAWKCHFVPLNLYPVPTYRSIYRRLSLSHFPSLHLSIHLSLSRRVRGSTLIFDKSVGCSLFLDVTSSLTRQYFYSERRVRDTNRPKRRPNPGASYLPRLGEFVTILFRCAHTLRRTAICYGGTRHV